MTTQPAQPTVDGHRYAQQVGLVAASAVSAGTFARSLGPRSAVDQGIITGLSTTLTYVLTVGSQDVITLLAGTGPGDGRGRILLADALAVPLGIALQRALPARPEERVLRSLIRQAGWRASLTGVGALVAAGVDTAMDRADPERRVPRLLVAAPVGFAAATLLSLQRRRDTPDEPFAGESGAAAVPDFVPGPPVAASVATGAAVVGTITGVVLGEQALASLISSQVLERLPGSPQLWHITSHGLVLLGSAAGVAALWGRAMRGVESGTTELDDTLADLGRPTALTTVSGTPDSLVPWETLGREGRRHVVTVVRPEARSDRPAGLPDLSIATVTGQPAVAEPVQVYVGLDSAPTARERVALALAEMDRTRAWDRKLLMLVSPTGTGYVNYCAVAAAQYLTRGDVATVTLQYSKRPSPLSLGKVDDAREQNRVLWLEVAKRVRAMPPEQRPRVVVFGESLGAHTSQDVFLHWGTLGPEALGIDRALWIGTPYASGWMQQVTRGDRVDVDPDVVAVVNDFGQVEAMGPQRRERLRYVMISHDNDGVTKFGTDLLAKAPRWLTDERPKVEHVPPYSPRGVPTSMRWRPLTTFFQLLVDMKNAQVAGQYRANGHDYRPDLTRFVNEVFGLGADEETLVKVEAAVERRERFREGLQDASPEEVAKAMAAVSAVPGSA